MYYLYNKNNLFKGSLNLVISKAVGEAAFNVSFLTPKSSTSPPMPPRSLFASPVPGRQWSVTMSDMGLGLQPHDLGWNPHSSTDSLCDAGQDA